MSALRYAYNTNGAANHRLDDAIRLIADSGYQGVALTLDHHHLDPFADGWRAEAERVAALLASLNLGSVVETGAPQAIELWTFVRRPGRPWILSAIQQTA